MMPHLEELIEALREELRQYGELLALLDQQQEQVLTRATGELLCTVAAINGQTATLQKARQYREACHHELARVLQLSEQTSLGDTLPLLPENYRPLLQALVQENNELLTRIRQRTRQNHLLLSRSLDSIQNFLRALFPSGNTPVYNEKGRMPEASAPVGPLYEAVG